MCGVFGATGIEDAASVVEAALRRMEYRGYDSAGIASINQGAFHLCRSAGPIDNLAARLRVSPAPGKIAIGHTRWATHGIANETNAHPHVVGQVAVVHNGIIENHDILKQELANQGLFTTSETDSEVVALLIEQQIRHGAAPAEAVRRSLARLKGTYALVVMILSQPDTLYASRRGSPLAIGHGKGFNLAGSDAVALAPVTPYITYLEEGDFAVITPTDVTVTDMGGKPAYRPIVRVEDVAADLSREGFDHYMIKEIHEQPQILARLINTHLDLPQERLRDTLHEIGFDKARKIALIACGTSYYACRVAQYWLEQACDAHLTVEIASEAAHRNLRLGAGDIAIFVSQSGETADTLGALRSLRGSGCQIVSILNTVASTMARESDVVLPIMAGVEIGVASTKAFTAQLMILALLALEARRQGGQALPQEILTDLRNLPEQMRGVIDMEDGIALLAGDIAQARSCFFIGRGSLYPVAQEGALKLKEISYIHAEAHAAGELKHGPIAMIDASLPSLVLSSDNEGHYAKTMSSAAEIAARKGPVHIIADEAAPLSLTGGHSIILPKTASIGVVFLQAAVLQLLAYHASLALGRNPDRPRNLAKSVTVG